MRAAAERRRFDFLSLRRDDQALYAEDVKSLGERLELFNDLPNVLGFHFYSTRIRS